MRIHAWAGLVALLIGAPAASGLQEGAVKSQTVEYRHGETVLEGYLAWDPAIKGRRPSVLVVHDWKGHGEYVRRRADQLARLGYLAFAIDMYGKGVFAKDHEEAGRLMGVFVKTDRKLMRERSAAALELLQKHELCDAKRIAAMGYCFGGTTALEMARAGSDLKGVASFHGNLATPHPEDAKNIKGKVIIFHGQDDNFVGEEIVKAFHSEMKNASVDYVFVGFAGAVHGFTIKELGNDPSKGLAYNEKADRRSWEILKIFLKEIFE